MDRQMRDVQFEIFKAFRFAGMSERSALKAAGALSGRDAAALRAKLRVFKFLFGAALLASLVIYRAI